jgi:hypothetical protein
VVKIQFPFWGVTESEDSNGKPQCSRRGGKSLYAFTTAAKLTVFLDARDPGVRTVFLVADREALIRAMADAQLNGEATIRCDPRPDGSGGRRLRLARFLR